MAWALEGLEDWLKEGLAPPPAVRQATDKYRAEMDVLGSSLQARTVADPRATTPFRALYDDYVSWSQEQGEQPLGPRTFGTRLSDKGYPPATLHDGRTSARRGIRLQDTPEPSGPRSGGDEASADGKRQPFSAPWLNPRDASVEPPLRRPASARRSMKGARDIISRP